MNSTNRRLQGLMKRSPVSVDEAQKRDLIMAKQIRQSTTKILQRPSGTHWAEILRIMRLRQDTAASLRYSHNREKLCALGDCAKLQHPSDTHRAERNSVYQEITPRYCKVPQVHTEKREILCIRRLRQDTAASFRHKEQRETFCIRRVRQDTAAPLRNT